MPLDYEQTAAALAAGVQKAVAQATAPLVERIAALEAREPEKGEKGDTGERGLPGEAGRDGIGLAGAIINRDGELVVTLADGSAHNLGTVVGRDGRDGVDGKDGNPGADGKDGADGAPGEKGEQGEPGQDGRDGLDAYPGEAKGLFDPEAQYRARDVVAHGGSAWMAKRDDPGELPGDGWMLLAGRGKTGGRGERGERGQEGRAGKDGAQPIALKFDMDMGQFVMVLDSGEVLEADLEPVIRAIRGEE